MDVSNAHVRRLSNLLEHIEGGELEKAIKDQQKTIEALRSFLEDKVSASRKENPGEKSDAPNWPSTTITAAYLAATLFSSVVSVCATKTVINSSLRRTQAHILDLIASRRKYRISADGRVNVGNPQASSAMSEASVFARKATTTSDGNAQHGMSPGPYGKEWVYEYKHRIIGPNPRAPSRSAADSLSQFCHASSRSATRSLAQFCWDTAPDSRVSKLSEPYPDYDPVFSDSDGS
jgi:hypothetical protein